MKNAVLENPANPDEFLFIQQFHASPFNRTEYWFGNKYDVFFPGNIIGIALDDSADGRVRVQMSPKYIPGIFSNLRLGALYRAGGGNGGLLPFTGEEGTKPVGMGISQNDFYFFGAMTL
jgi:hypothetical protein